jgi:alkanesulfonate monooxygenase SsuD/methylene tetrahydromethanopterin reductase-like flavin-dependent oxidoreductase (luciferase family)
MAVIVAPMRRKALVGSAATVREKMQALARSLALDHLVVNTWAHDPAVRRHSYALLAREFGLEGNRAPGTAPGSEAREETAVAFTMTT